MKETNEIKEKDIEEILRRIKRGEEIKKLILEKEKLLFDKNKRLSELKEGSKQNRNKYERFNQNLQRQKMVYQESFVSYGKSNF